MSDVPLLAMDKEEEENHIQETKPNLKLKKKKKKQFNTAKMELNASPLNEEISIYGKESPISRLLNVSLERSQLRIAKHKIVSTQEIYSTERNVKNLIHGCCFGIICCVCALFLILAGLATLELDSSQDDTPAVDGNYTAEYQGSTLNHTGNYTVDSYDENNSNNSDFFFILFATFALLSTIALCFAVVICALGFYSCYCFAPLHYLNIADTSGNVHKLQILTNNNEEALYHISSKNPQNNFTTYSTVNEPSGASGVVLSQVSILCETFE